MPLRFLCLLLFTLLGFRAPFGRRAQRAQKNLNREPPEIRERWHTRTCQSKKKTKDNSFLQKVTKITKNGGRFPPSFPLFASVHIVGIQGPVWPQSTRGTKKSKPRATRNTRKMAHQNLPVQNNKGQFIFTKGNEVFLNHIKRKDGARQIGGHIAGHYLGQTG